MISNLISHSWPTIFGVIRGSTTVTVCCSKDPSVSDPSQQWMILLAHTQIISIFPTYQMISQLWLFCGHVPNASHMLPHKSFINQPRISPSSYPPIPQWPFQVPKLEVPSIFFRSMWGLYKGISFPNSLLDPCYPLVICYIAIENDPLK